MAAPVSASACHPGFVVIYPSSSFQFSQPSFSGIVIPSLALNQGDTIQFSRPTFSSSAPGFLIKGKAYTPSNPFRWYSFSFFGSSLFMSSLSPLPTLRESPIEYIVYITKENRTYDEVLGQLKEAKGDATLARFGVGVSVRGKMTVFPWPM